MNRFRLWSLRASILHGYLIAAMVLLPLPPSMRVVADEDPPPEPPPEEMWYLDHSESMMSVSLQSLTGGASPSSTITLGAYVENTSWEVWTSSFGNVQTANYSSGPAPYTDISWYQDSGNGYLSNSESSTSSSGTATSDFVMGNIQAVVRVEVGNGNGGVASATLTVDPDIAEETWSYGYSGSTITSVLWQDSAGATMANGEERTLMVTVSEDDWEVWDSSWGNSQTSVTTSGVASNVPVTFFIQSGDGLLNYNSSVVTSTDALGQASVTFVMGSSDTVVGVVAGDASQYPVSGSNVGFTAAPTEGEDGGGDDGGGDDGGGDDGGGDDGGDDGGETWDFAGTESSYAVTMMADEGVTEMPQGSPLGGFTAWVTTTTHDVYVSNWGNTYNGEDTTAYAGGVPVWLTVDGEADPFSTASTDGGGSSYGTSTSLMGTDTVRVWACATMDEGQTALASTYWEIAPVAEQWWHSRDETTIFASLTTDAAQTDVAAGAQCTASVNVTYSQWEVWESSAGGFELRNCTTGAAEGASVWFSVESGDGAVDGSVISTDSQGQATTTFTMGEAASVLRVDSWFLTATSAASLNFTPSEVVAVWNYDHSDAALDVQMMHEAGSGSVTAWVSYVTWDVYVLSTDPNLVEYRNVASSAAGGAQVSFSIDTGSVVDDLVWTGVNGDASTAYQTDSDATVTAYVSFGGGMTQTGTIAVEASDNSLRITTNSLPDGTVGSSYAASIVAAGGTGPYTFTQSGGNGLPSGYQLHSNGSLTGSGGSQQEGSYTFTVQASDSASPSHTVQKELTLVLQAAAEQPLGFASTNLPNGMVGWGYNVRVPTQGGVGALTVSAQDALPPGLSLSVDGMFSGMPTAAGAYSFGIQAHDESYDPTTATFRTIYAVFSLVVLGSGAVNVTIVGGDKQIIKVGEAPDPVRVSLKVGGAGFAGAEVALGSQTAVTGSNGIATFVLPPVMAGGEHNLAVSTPDGGGPTVQLYAAPVPPALTAPSPGVTPGAPEMPPETPVEDDDVIIESRWVSTSSGTLVAHWNSGMAVSEDGHFVTYYGGGGGSASNGGQYSSTQSTWATSDGQSGVDDEPPSLDSLPWKPGLAGGYDRKYLDTEDGPVDAPDGSEGETWPSGIPLKLIYNGFWSGKSVGRQKHVTAQVRMRRKAVEEGGSGSNQAVEKYFADLTKERNSDGVDIDTNACTADIALDENENESIPVVLNPEAEPASASSRNLQPIQIIPDINMVGVVGDLLDSAKPDDPAKSRSALKHFVSPKKINEYIVFTIIGLTADQMTNNFASTQAGKIAKWDGGEEVPGEPLKRRVSRNEVGKLDLKIKMRDDSGTHEQTKIRVWITWCVGHVERYGHPIYDRRDGTTSGGVTCKQAVWGFPSGDSVDWKFAFTIQPPEIITGTNAAKEIPDLKDEGNALVPTTANPTTEKPTVKMGNLSPKDAPVHKWDVSRRMKIRVVNPSGIPATAFSSGYENVFSGQPNSDSEPVKFPADLVVGNDDDGDGSDERTNPYMPEPDRAVYPGETPTYNEIGHQNIGVITSVDTPEIWLPELQGESPATWGSEGSTFEEYDDFEEFARLQIGKRWYVVSDPVPWTHYGKFKKINGKWENMDSEPKTLPQNP